MWNTELKRPKTEHTPIFLRRGFIMGLGISSIVFSLIVLGMSIFEGVFNSGNVHVLELPGFHELKLDKTGLYAGIYQHRATTPLPIKELTQMDVRVMSKDDYEEIPVLMNTSGQTFDRLGVRGLPLFNFAINQAGSYTLSGVYTGLEGPKVQVLLVPQTIQNLKQTLLVGIGFFIFFLVLGIVVLVRLKRSAPPKKKPLVS